MTTATKRPSDPPVIRMSPEYMAMLQEFEERKKRMLAKYGKQVNKDKDE